MNPNSERDEVVVPGAPMVDGQIVEGAESDASGEADQNDGDGPAREGALFLATPSRRLRRLRGGREEASAGRRSLLMAKRRKRRQPSPPHLAHPLAPAAGFLGFLARNQ